MELEQPKAVLTYGKHLGDSHLPAVDVSQPGWKEKLGDYEPNSRFYCLKEAYFEAARTLGPAKLVQVSSVPEAQPLAAAARIGDIVVSPTVCKAALKSSVWISPYHLDVIKEILAKGFIVEILDETGAIIRRL